jgi:hypothetical protein
MIQIIAIANCVLATAQVNNIDNIYKYRWVNVVVGDPYGSPFLHNDTVLNAPYIDPPYKGFRYNKADKSPYYWDDAHFIGEDAYKINSYTNLGVLKFEDCPNDDRLKEEERINFKTLLVNTDNDSIVYEFNWYLDSENKTGIGYVGESYFDLEYLLYKFKNE